MLVPVRDVFGARECQVEMWTDCVSNIFILDETCACVCAALVHKHTSRLFQFIHSHTGAYISSRCACVGVCIYIRRFSCQRQTAGCTAHTHSVVSSCKRKIFSDDTEKRGHTPFPRIHMQREEKCVRFVCSAARFAVYERAQFCVFNGVALCDWFLHAQSLSITNPILRRFFSFSVRWRRRRRRHRRRWHRHLNRCWSCSCSAPDVAVFFSSFFFSFLFNKRFHTHKHTPAQPTHEINAEKNFPIFYHRFLVFSFLSIFGVFTNSFAFCVQCAIRSFVPRVSEFSSNFFSSSFFKI